MDKKLRLGVIGIGLAWDRLHYPAFQQLTDQYEIIAVCDKESSKAQGFGQKIGLATENIYDDFVKLLERDDLDVVDVLVPITENFEIYEAAILAGKDLIAEKPFASTPKAASLLIQLKEKHHVQVMVAENFRYDEGNKIKEVRGIRAGCKIMKTRYNKPFEDIELQIPYDTGLDPYTGLFSLFEKRNIFVKEGNRYVYTDISGNEHKYFRKQWIKN